MISRDVFNNHTFEKPTKYFEYLYKLLLIQVECELILKIGHGNYTDNNVKPSDVESNKDILQVFYYESRRVLHFLFSLGEVGRCMVTSKQNQTKPQDSLGRYMEALIVILLTTEETETLSINPGSLSQSLERCLISPSRLANAVPRSPK